jgi:heme/copper-type cytochrome/quinol oxidase subunit 2
MKIYAHDMQSNFFFPHSPVLEGMINLHHDLFTYLIAIILLISYLLLRVVLLFKWDVFISPKLISHSDQIKLEIAWTVLPAIILFFVGVSSLALLYAIEEPREPIMTVHIMGHQWYWTYAYPMFKIKFDSCLVPESELLIGDLRLLEVDNRLVLPFGSHIRLLITSADVLHSWCLPSLGIKVDACPGRLSQCHLFCKSINIFFGQCSEICGVGHAFMPIVMQAIDLYNFSAFLTYKQFKILF